MVIIVLLDDLQLLKRKEVEHMKAEKGGTWNSISTQPTGTPQRQSLLNRSQESPVNNDMLQLLLGVLQNSPASITSAAKLPANSDPDQVKIGKVLCVPNSCYQQARQCKSATAMTMYLVRAAFSRRRLLKSSYAGQRRKLPNGEIFQKPSLKRYQAMRDIQDFVLARFPISQSAFGSAVNACTGEKARSRPEVEYEAEMSDDEEVV
ncbi:hypothetical protein KUF71_016342 [Frankliniella fusca]|uniref:Uncharacterized protein n=1 Tax=Frankliniella fusca TaxID=407009 RepID=A0AAE1LIC6_9NEOP|nr:hypothetical protein KUF71_009970 [Frankliniella fusca]KAK3928059.1 hypothetical protein KUF71_016342 [Frankliniella fusca]